MSVRSRGRSIAGHPVCQVSTDIANNRNDSAIDPSQPRSIRWLLDFRSRRARAYRIVWRDEIRHLLAFQNDPIPPNGWVLSSRRGYHRGREEGAPRGSRWHRLGSRLPELLELRHQELGTRSPGITAGAAAGEVPAPASTPRDRCPLARADPAADEKHHLPRLELFKSRPKESSPGARPRGENSGASGVLHQGADDGEWAV